MASLRRRAASLVVATVAVPVAAWGIEEAARKAEARDPKSTTSKRLRQVADVAQTFAQGPIADRLRARQRTRVKWGEPEIHYPRGLPGPVPGQAGPMSPRVEIRPLGGWPGCLAMIVISVIGSVLLTVLLNLLLN